MTTLLASSPSIEGILKCAMKFFYSTHLTLEQTGENEWAVVNSKGAIPSVRIVLQKKRYRFEMV